MKTRLYVGIREGAKREILRSATEPTHATHGADYLCTIGPFRTRRGAEFMRDYGRGNPHCVCVADAERLARREAAFLRRIGPRP